MGVTLNEIEPDGKQGLKDMVRRYTNLFAQELPNGVPLEKQVDDTIEIYENATPLYCLSHHLSPAEVIAAKDYISKLLKVGKIRRSKYPFGASLFFVKRKRKLKIEIDYRALNLVAKKSKAPIPCIHET